MNDNTFFIRLDNTDPAKVVLGSAFRSHTQQLHDASIHYVLGGSGPAIIFLHGFSEDWYEFSQVMCLLANSHTVIAVELRGIGESKALRADYDAETLANDIHELTGHLAIKDPEPVNRSETVCGTNYRLTSCVRLGAGGLIHAAVGSGGGCGTW